MGDDERTGTRDAAGGAGETVTDGRGDGRGDDGRDDVEEQFRSLMEGLRTSLPGVQVLFAFLLTAPLQSAFRDLDDLQKTSFAVAFYASGIASALLIAPSVHQRVRAPITGLKRRSERHLRWAIWVAIVGSVAMGVAMLATVFLVSAVVFNDDFAAGATGVVTAALAWAWFYLPLVTFNRDRGGRT